MVITTRITSENAAFNAGMKSLSDTTRPKTAMVDIFRKIAFNEIKRITGEDDPTVDYDGQGENAEYDMTKIMIQNIINGTSYNWRMNQDARIELANAFGNFMPYNFEPNKDGGTDSTYSGPYTGI